MSGDGSAALSYGGLKAWDATGRSLPAHFEARDAFITVTVDDGGATYPVTIDPIAQQAYLKASNTEARDFFGRSVAVSGDTVVVGAYGEDSKTTGVNSVPNDDGTANFSGAAYIFVRKGGTWSQQAYLKASNTGAGDYFGISVAISGDTAVVGAYLEDSISKGVDSVPVDGGAGDYGAAYVFVRSGDTWSQQAYLKASSAGGNDFFGSSVALSGDTVVVGAPRESSGTTGVDSVPDYDLSAYRSGAAFVFTRSGGTWSQQAYLKASNTGADDFFGYSVTVSGDLLVIGALNEDSKTVGVDSVPIDDGTANDSGAAYVFTRSGGTWSQQAYLKAAHPGAGDSFGASVAASGETVVVGAAGEDSKTVGVDSVPNDDGSANGSGAAYVFTRTEGSWTQEGYLKASNTGASDTFGVSVAVSGETVVVGAYQEDSRSTGVDSVPDDDGTANDSGAAYIFTRSGAKWSQRAYLKASNTGADDQFGLSVAVSGDTVVVGSPQEDSKSTGVDSAPADDGSATNAGAAYLFTFFDPAIPNPVPARPDLLIGSRHTPLKGDNLYNSLSASPQQTLTVPARIFTTTTTRVQLVLQNDGGAAATMLLRSSGDTFPRMTVFAQRQGSPSRNIASQMKLRGYATPIDSGKEVRILYRLRTDRFFAGVLRRGDRDDTVLFRLTGEGRTDTAALVQKFR